MKKLGFTAVVAFGLYAGTSLPGWTDDEAGRDPAVPPSPEELFKSLDKDDDGKIVADELSDEQLRFFDRLVRLGDADENGELSKDEFTKAIDNDEFRPQPPPRDGDRRRPGQRDRGPNPEQMFDRIDQNKDGSISVEEAPERIRPMLERMLKNVGKESTATLSKEEFMEIAKNFRPERGPREGGPRPEGAPGRGPRPDGAPGEGRGPRDGERPEGRGPRDGEGFGPGGERGRPPMPRFIQELDANDDGQISKEELAQLAEKFEALDENGDGVLDPRELMGPPPEGRFGEGPFNRPREGFRGPGPQGRGRPDGRPGEGRPEAGRGRPEGAPGRPDRPEGGPNPEQLLKRLDKNQDGKLSQDEAPERMKERFSRIDANGDGAIDLEELKRMVEQRGNRPDGERPKGPRGDRPGEKKPEGDAN